MTDHPSGKPIVDRHAAARCAKRIMGRPWLFLGRALSSFRRNQGLLLSGAVAYYTLLSIVPLMALVLVGLSHVLDEKELLDSVVAHLELLLPREAAAITAQLTAFLAQRHVVGGTGMVVLVFFSTVAFSVLESAMSVIFYHRVEHQRRHFLVSLLIPFGFVLLVGASVFLVTFISGAVHALDERGVQVFGYTWQMGRITGVGLYLLGVLGLILLMTALYLVLPAGRIAPRHALVGGIVAGVLWEIARHILVWYFSTLSLVNVIYGSLATAVVALLSFEIAAMIFLFGAQVIAEFERCSLGDGAGFET
jgi:YihY family inner membrane protein